MVNYANNKDMIIELKISHAQDKMTEKLGRMFSLICIGISSKSNFRGYSYREDMVSSAVLQLVEKWKLFDLNRFDKPFSYFSMIAFNSFRASLNREKRVRDIRDNIIQMQSTRFFKPSMTRQVENEFENKE